MIGSVGYPDWINRLPSRIEELGSISDPIVQMAYDEIISEGRVSISTGESLFLQANLIDVMLLGHAIKKSKYEIKMGAKVSNLIARTYFSYYSWNIPR